MPEKPLLKWILLRRLPEQRRESSHRPGLEDPELRTFDAELDIQGMPVGRFEPIANGHQFGQFDVFKGGAEPLVVKRRGSDHPIAGTRVEHHLFVLVGSDVPEPKRSGLQVIGLGNHNVIGGDRPGNNALAEAKTHVDDHFAEFVLGDVDRLKHSGNP